MILRIMPSASALHKKSAERFTISEISLLLHSSPTLRKYLKIPPDERPEGKKTVRKLEHGWKIWEKWMPRKFHRLWMKPTWRLLFYNLLISRSTKPAVAILIIIKITHQTLPVQKLPNILPWLHYKSLLLYDQQIPLIYDRNGYVNPAVP